MTTHTYATNSPVHPRLIAFLALLSAAISVVIGGLAARIQSAWGFSVGGASAMTVFGILYFIFEQWLWRVGILRRLLLVPNLNGNWKCVGKTVKKDGQDAALDWEGNIRITQSWSRISIVLTTAQSSSRSIAASLYNYPGEGYRLIFHYENAPRADQPALVRHSGLCDLMFSENLDGADGNYFTGKDRLTVGTMHLTKGGKET